MKASEVPNVDYLFKLKLAKRTATFEPSGIKAQPFNLLEFLQTPVESFEEYQRHPCH
jgi:hypothetical protein